MADPFKIEVTEGALAELADIPVFHRRQIFNAIEEQLSYQPVQPTRNRKILNGLKPPWEGGQPTWELRIGLWRVFYDVDEEHRQVFVRAVRQKLPHQTTDQTL